MLVADAVQTLHNSGIEHGQLCSGQQHHILYDYDTKRVNVVDFSSASLHVCYPPEVKLEPLFHSMPCGTICGELRLVGNLLDFWNPKRANERPRGMCSLCSHFSATLICLFFQDVPKDGEQNDQVESLAVKTVAVI